MRRDRPVNTDSPDAEALDAGNLRLSRYWVRSRDLVLGYRLIYQRLNLGDGGGVQ